MAERPLLAGRLGVDVHHGRVAGLAERMGRKLAVEPGERIVERLHEDPPEHVDDEQARAAGVLDDRRAPSGRAGGIVGGADEAGLALDEHQGLALVEGVVAERHGVDAHGEELFEDRLGEAETAGGVLAVDDEEIELPARPQQRRLLNDRRATGPSDDVANEQEPHSALAYEDGFPFRHNRVQGLIMRLIRHGGDFANPISDADRPDCLHRPQPQKRPVVEPGAVADAPAAAVVAGERREQEIRIDEGGPVQRLRDSHRAERGRLARSPQTELEVGFAPPHHRQGDVETLAGQRAEEGERVRLLADRMKGGDHGRLPQVREPQAFADKPRGQLRPDFGGKRLAARERAPAELGLQIGDGRGQGGAPISAGVRGAETVVGR